MGAGEPVRVGRAGAFESRATVSTSRRKGSSWERQVCDYLAEATGLPVERRVQAGANDRGDVAGIPRWVIECKNTKSIDLAQGMKEALKEKSAAKADFSALVVKRRNYPVAEGYAVMSVSQLAALMRAQVK